MLSVTAVDAPVSRWWGDIPVQYYLSLASKERWCEPQNPLVLLFWVQLLYKWQ